MLRLMTQILLFVLALMLLGPGVAVGADSVPNPQPTLALPTDQVWTFVAGALVPLVAYVINHYAPWVDEKVKAIVQVLAAAVAGGITQAVVAGDVGFNDVTLQFTVTSVIAALTAHKFLWAPSNIAASLGGGSNSPSSLRS